MRVMMFVRRDPAIEMLPEDQAEMPDQVSAWVEEMPQRGTRLHGAVFEPADLARTVRLRDGKPQITSVPSALTPNTSADTTFSNALIWTKRSTSLPGTRSRGSVRSNSVRLPRCDDQPRPVHIGTSARYRRQVRAGRRSFVRTRLDRQIALIPGAWRAAKVCRFCWTDGDEPRGQDPPSSRACPSPSPRQCAARDHANAHPLPSRLPHRRRLTNALESVGVGPEAID
jgi:hypothetical protein